MLKSFLLFGFAIFVIALFALALYIYDKRQNRPASQGSFKLDAKNIKADWKKVCDDFKKIFK
ncbi:MAG TPA: hypothetical protein DIC64_00195 [Alphaproteobacteria bacterium]|nr:hypothetical protein [Alphaproteobacteria bacterium]